jgi:hypothetical protein
VGVTENGGPYSPYSHRLSNCPELHSHVLENSHPSETRTQTLLCLDSHFSYLTYGCFYLFFNYSHTYPPPPSPLSQDPFSNRVPDALPSARQISPRWEVSVSLPANPGMYLTSESDYPNHPRNSENYPIFPRAF